MTTHHEHPDRVAVPPGHPADVAVPPGPVPRGSSRRHVLTMAALATAAGLLPWGRDPAATASAAGPPGAAGGAGGAGGAGAAGAATLGGTDPNASHPELSHPECGGTRTRSARGAWGGHGNGRIPSGELTAVPATLGPWLRTDAALAYLAFDGGFRARFGKPLSITEGYRDLARQQYLHAGWTAHRPGFNLAAPPGTSVHGWALACDFGSGVDRYGTAEKAWADAVGPSYGWIPTGNGFAQREPWHFEFNGDYRGDDDMTPDQDQRLRNIEAILATENNGGMRAAMHSRFDNVEGILARENGGGVRGAVDSVQAAANNIESILAKENGGGMRAVLAAVRSRLGG